MQAGWALVFLLAVAGAASGAEAPPASSAASVARAMRLTRLSEGFEVRLSLSVVDAQGHRSAPIKLAVIGQFGAERARLLVRGISPQALQQQYFAAERDASGRLRAVKFGKQLSDGVAEIDPSTGLYGTALVLWDMLSPWWDWPQQSEAGAGKAAGHDCTIMRSLADALPAKVREVTSCVDVEAGLTLKTDLFDAQRARLRTIAVEQVTRSASGLAVVKRMTITSADKSATEVDVYAGDENYAITADTFAALDALSPTR